MSEPFRDLEASVKLDDSGAGLAMLVIFSSAVLIVTGAVVLVALVGGWWIVAFAFAIHVLMTTVVVVTIASVMNGRSSAGTGSVPVDSPRHEARPRRRSKPATAM
jgi:hypothetical protein